MHALGGDSNCGAMLVHCWAEFSGKSSASLEMTPRQVGNIFHGYSEITLSPMRKFGPRYSLPLQLLLLLRDCRLGRHCDWAAAILQASVAVDLLPTHSVRMPSEQWYPIAITIWDS